MARFDFDRDIWYPSALPPDIDELVDVYGTTWPGSPVPIGWRHRQRRRSGYCYTAAGSWYWLDGITYTEGRARHGPNWVPHAWLTTDAGTVIDLGWSEPGTEYVGIPIPDRIVAQAHVLLGSYVPLLPTAIRALGWQPATRRAAQR